MALTAVPLRLRDIRPKNRSDVSAWIKLALAERGYDAAAVHTGIASTACLFIKRCDDDGTIQTSALMLKRSNQNGMHLEIRPLEHLSGATKATFIFLRTSLEKIESLVRFNEHPVNAPVPTGIPGGPFKWHELLSKAATVQLGFDPKALRKNRTTKRCRAGKDGYISSSMRGETPHSQPVPPLVRIGSRRRANVVLGGGRNFPRLVEK